MANNHVISVGGVLYANGSIVSTGGISDGDKGDITVSGTGSTLTIDNNVVTYAKMQDVSATSRVLGRATAGSGDIEELTGTQVAAMLPAASASIASAVAIANTETVVVSYTAAANTLAAGTTFRVKAFCSQAGTNAATPTIRIRIGTTTLTGNIAATLTGAIGSSAVPSHFEGLITIRTTGSSGTVIGGLTQLKSAVAVATNTLTATVAVNTTVQNLIELTFISGQSSNTYTFQVASIEKLN